MSKYLITILTALLTTGCITLAPDYSRPEMPVPEEWAVSAEESEPVYMTLEEFITDERLLAVVNQALENNRDLRAQISNVEAARANYNIQRSVIFPNVNAGAGATRSGETGPPMDSFSLEVGVTSYELDFFGKNRSQNESVLEQYLASGKYAEAARISLIAETVNAWATLAADRDMLQLAKGTVESAAQSAEVARGRYEAGVTSMQDVYQAETTYQQALADVANYTALVAQDMNALELLTGGAVDAALLPDGFEGSGDWLGDISGGLSSEILLNRPDIAAAEHMLKSANADIGAARAAFFPSISLTGSAGYASSELGELLLGGNWAFGGMINLPIFAGGRNKATLEYSKMMYEAYVAEYEGAVQTAFKEVSDTLARKSTIGSQIEAQTRLAQISRDSYELAEARYSAGVDSYLNVLTSQRTFYGAEQALISIKLTELTNRITLYKVLGGDHKKDDL